MRNACDKNIKCEQGEWSYIASKYVAYDGQMGEKRENLEPDANVLGLVADGAPRAAHELLRVQPDLDDVVQQSEERRERERGHEDRDEAELHDCVKETGAYRINYVCASKNPPISRYSWNRPAFSTSW